MIFLIGGALQLPQRPPCYSVVCFQFSVCFSVCSLLCLKTSLKVFFGNVCFGWSEIEAVSTSLKPAVILLASSSQLKASEFVCSRKEKRKRKKGDHEAGGVRFGCLVKYILFYFHKYYIKA